MGKYKYMRIMISVDGVMGEEATHKMTDERKECMEVERGCEITGDKLRIKYLSKIGLLGDDVQGKSEERDE